MRGDEDSNERGKRAAEGAAAWRAAMKYVRGQTFSVCAIPRWTLGRDTFPLRLLFSP